MLTCTCSPIHAHLYMAVNCCSRCMSCSLACLTDLLARCRLGVNSSIAESAISIGAPSEQLAACGGHCCVVLGNSNHCNLPPAQPCDCFRHNNGTLTTMYMKVWMAYTWSNLLSYCISHICDLHRVCWQRCMQVHCSMLAQMGRMMRKHLRTRAQQNSTTAQFFIASASPEMRKASLYVLHVMLFLQPCEHKFYMVMLLLQELLGQA